MLKLILLQQLPERYFHEKNERCLERRLILKILKLLTTSFHGLSIPNPEYSGIFTIQNNSCLFTYALSVYMAQNILCRSKFFVSDQKFIYILCQSQTFCSRQKYDLHSVKLVFVPAQKFLKRH